jgi:PAS domain-containing protein
MPQKNIEVILFRQLVSYISMPSFIVDQDGYILYCNPSAESALGIDFSEIGEGHIRNWQSLFTPKDKHGNSLPIEKTPIYITITQYRLACGKFYITDNRQQLKQIELFSIPLLNHSHTFLGFITFFQEIKL